MNNLHTFSDIKTLVFDVDGVMTDCSVLVMEDGQLLRTMNVRDGYAMKMAVRAGYRVIIITAGRSPGVEIRLRALGVTDILLGREDKATALLELMQQYGFSPEETLYMGDDVPDRGALQMVGLPTCPQDAIPEVREICRYISPIPGGKGCVRDVIEKVMRLQGHWPQ
jgi:3-deoxy-D-manno-octulosonate 8-phosphate phosphatase (KDO 8-P phosphatase)